MRIKTVFLLMTSGLFLLVAGAHAAMVGFDDLTSGDRVSDDYGDCLMAATVSAVSYLAVLFPALADIAPGCVIESVRCVRL